MTDVSKNCNCAIEIERLENEIEALKEELEAFQSYTMELIEALSETGNKFLGFGPDDYY